MARTTHRLTCEDLHRLDVRELARDGFLNGAGTITWTRGDRVTGRITIRGDGQIVTLAYVIDGQAIEEQVRLSQTHVHLGGHRSWFLCPGCDRRVGILYGARLFRCRYCHDLRYASQRESTQFRAISRIQRARIKLGGTADLSQPRPARPRYMHYTTYERLVKLEEDAWHSFETLAS
jgi:hypothetical protein